jgi:SAF domain
MQQRCKALLIDRRDNVAVALEDIAAGAPASILGPDGTSLEAQQPIPFGHKIARVSIQKGQPILKYGVPIGFALADISPGEWVHEHNAESYFLAKRKGDIHEPHDRLPKA